MYHASLPPTNSRNSFADQTVLKIKAEIKIPELFSKTSEGRLTRLRAC